MSQTNSFPNLHPPLRLLMPPTTAKKLSALQSQSSADHSRSSLGSCSAEEKKIISVETKRLEESPGSIILSLDYKLSSLWNGDVKPAYSPFRDLSLPDDAAHRLRTKEDLTLISVWWKSNPEKHKPKPNSVPPVSSSGSEEVLTDREALWVEVNESTPPNHSLNSRIAVAMGGLNDEGFSNKTVMCSWETKDLRPIPDREYYRNGSRLVEKKPRRNWVMRKLRRPAWFFGFLQANLESSFTKKTEAQKAWKHQAVIPISCSLSNYNCGGLLLLHVPCYCFMYYNNAYYAKVGGVTPQEMNKLELEFLFALRFCLHIRDKTQNPHQQMATWCSYAGL